MSFSAGALNSLAVYSFVTRAVSHITGNLIYMVQSVASNRFVDFWDYLRDIRPKKIWRFFDLNKCHKLDLLLGNAKKRSIP